jgi:hypothetical protein
VISWFQAFAFKLDLYRYNAYSCDMRAAHAYVVSAAAYPLMLQEILGTPGYGVIDAGTMQRIPQQVFTTPMLAVQKHAQADLITPAQQLGGAKFADAHIARSRTILSCAPRRLNFYYFTAFLYSF